MGCIHRKWDRDGAYCSITNMVCHSESGCPDRTDDAPAFNSTTGQYEKFVNGALSTTDASGTVRAFDSIKPMATDEAPASKQNSVVMKPDTIDRIYTVGDLKKFLERIPDDAFVYEQIKPDGKELQAIESDWKYDGDNCTKTCRAWDFPDFVILPLSSRDTMEQLTEIYDRHHEDKEL